MLFLFLAACGGSGNSKHDGPPVEPFFPFVRSISPAVAPTGVATAFTLTGTNLQIAIGFA